PVPHHELQDIVGLIEAAEFAGIGHLAAEDFRQIFTRHHILGACNERGEKSVEFFDIHRLAAFAGFEKFSKVVEFSVRQGLVLGESLHGHSRCSRQPVYDTTVDWLAVFDSKALLSARLSLLKPVSSPEYRLCGRSLRTAIPSAFFC